MSSPLLMFFTDSSLNIFSYRVNFPVLSSIIHLLLAQIMRMNAKKMYFCLMLDSLQNGFRVLISFVPQNSLVRKQTVLPVALQNLIFWVLTYSHAFCISSSQNTTSVSPLPCEMLLRILKDQAKKLYLPQKPFLSY